MTTNVTTQDLKLIIESYKAWRSLNATLSHFASRTVNFPEAISDSHLCQMPADPAFLENSVLKEKNAQWVP